MFSPRVSAFTSATHNSVIIDFLDLSVSKSQEKGFNFWLAVFWRDQGLFACRSGSFVPPLLHSGHALTTQVLFNNSRRDPPLPRYK